MSSAALLVPQSQILTDGDGQQNSSSSPNNFAKTIVFKGTVAQGGAIPSKALVLFSDISKSALPNTDDATKYEYFATATSESGLTADGEFGTTPGTALTFTIALVIGEKWNVTCGLRESSTKAVVMKDFYEFESKADEPVFTRQFCLEACKDGSGSVGLEITVPSDVVDAKVECSDPRWAAASPDVSVVPTKLTISAAEIESGFYDIYIRLFNNDNVLVYGITQTINVLDGANTNYWRSSGGEDDELISSGAFTIGAAALAAFSQTVFYVGDTGAKGAKGKSDYNDGTAYAPFETINRAAAVISSIGIASKNYRIFVCGTAEGNSLLAGSLNGKARSITIEGFDALGEDSKPVSALDAKKNGRALVIETNVSVTLKNLRVTGGLHESDVPAAGGSGVYLGGSADLTLAGDVVVESNHATWYAGGIFVSGGASLKIKGAVTVYGNTHGAAASTAASNLYLSSGAKIQILDALKTTDAAGERKSKIGITCSDDLTGSAPELVFTQGYAAKNAGVSPLEYFYGDKYGVTSAASGEAELSLSGGGVALDPVYDDITIKADKTLLSKDLAQKKITFTASANVGGSPVAIPAGSGAGKVSYTFSVAYHGETVPQTYGGKDYYETGTDSVTLFDVPVGSYMICVTAVCGGNAYGGEFEVTIIDALVPQGAEGTALADSMLDPSVANLKIFFENDFTAATPEFPDDEKEASGYYYWNDSSSKWQRKFACVVPAGKTLTLMAEKPVTFNCNSVYKMFNVSGTLVIGKNVTIEGGLHHNVIDVKSGGTLILDGGTIKRGIGGGAVWSAVTVYDGGKFIMKDGLMTENLNRGAVRVENGGRFEMSGGEISGNVGESAGGVLVAAGGEFIKSGGIVKGNTSSSGSSAQMVIYAGGKYGASESTLTTYDSITEFADEF